MSWGGLRLGHARDGVAEQRSDGSEQTYHKQCRFVSQDASTGSESGLGSPHNTLHKQGACRHAPTSTIDRPGRLWPALALRRAILGRANFLMKRYWSRLHYPNKWRTSANQAMSHSSEIQPGNHPVEFK